MSKNQQSTNAFSNIRSAAFVDPMAVIRKQAADINEEGVTHINLAIGSNHPLGRWLCPQRQCTFFIEQVGRCSSVDGYLAYLMVLTAGTTDLSVLAMGDSIRNGTMTVARTVHNALPKHIRDMLVYTKRQLPPQLYDKFLDYICDAYIAIFENESDGRPIHTHPMAVQLMAKNCLPFRGYISNESGVRVNEFRAPILEAIPRLVARLKELRKNYVKPEQTPALERIEFTGTEFRPAEEGPRMRKPSRPQGPMRGDWVDTKFGNAGGKHQKSAATGNPYDRRSVGDVEFGLLMAKVLKPAASKCGDLPFLMVADETTDEKGVSSVGPARPATLDELEEIGGMDWDLKYRNLEASGGKTIDPEFPDAVYPQGTTVQGVSVPEGMMDTLQPVGELVIQPEVESAKAFIDPVLLPIKIETTEDKPQDPAA